MPAAKLPAKSLPWPIAWSGVALIARYESCVLTAYKDIAGIWTIGWGETDNVIPGMVWSQAIADETLCHRLLFFAEGVDNALGKTPVTDNQRAAFVAFAYNVGLASFRKSSALRLFKAGNTADVPAALLLWNKATVNGKLQVVAGLTNRRKAEGALFLTPDETPVKAPVNVTPENILTAGMPEQSAIIGQQPEAAKECERGLAQSSTMQAGAAAAGVSALSAAGQIADQVQSVTSATSGVAQNVSAFPAWLLIALSIAGLVAGGIVCWRIYARWKAGKA